LITAINAENAAHKSEKFVAMATRTRQEYLKDLATNSVTHAALDSGSKLSKYRMEREKIEIIVVQYMHLLFMFFIPLADK